MSFSFKFYILALVLLFNINACVNNEINNSILFEEVNTKKQLNGKLYRINNFYSNYTQSRNIDIWIPKNYSKEKIYSVLYMHDGQNLFDNEKTWGGTDWGVDENASMIMLEGNIKDFIVVGIWNVAKNRFGNYFPKKIYNMLSNKDQKKLKDMAITNGYEFVLDSDDYLKFLVYELKPIIDKNFKTSKNKTDTFIMGSSRGGLISLYALCEYPKIFGGAASLSTHWLGTYSNNNNDIPKKTIDYLKMNLPKTDIHKVYLDYGNLGLDELYLPFQKNLNSFAINNRNFRNIFFENHDHSEFYWNKRLQVPLKFLLKN